MQVCYSSKSKALPANSAITKTLASVTETYLRHVVETISVPRHALEQPRNNKFVAQWITDRLQEYGYRTFSQGQHQNVVALPADYTKGPLILIGAHYDSVPETPGADDNASAVAALLACAKAVSESGVSVPVCFVAFNREEDSLMGSCDFVKHYLPVSELRIQEAHILEMVGYCDHRPGRQHLPPGLPIKVPDTGDFLGLIANSGSLSLIDILLQQAISYLPDFPVVGLKVMFGLEKRVPHLERSDHAPFWAAGIPTLMWTDTSEFRNPHYHAPTDTPDSLDYPFLKQVTQLLTAQVLLFILPDRFINE